MEDCETAVTCWVEEEAQVVPLCWIVKDTPGVTSSNLNTGKLAGLMMGLIKTTGALLTNDPHKHAVRTEWKTQTSTIGAPCYINRYRRSH